MATKNFANIDDLSVFKELLEGEIGTAEAKSLHVVQISGNTLNFYKSENPVAGDTPDYSIELPTTDLSNYMTKIASASGGKIATTTSAGLVEESATSISDLATNAFVGSIPSGATATTVTGYVDEAIDDAIESLATSSDVTIASKSSNAITITASIKEEDGVIAKGSATDITLADVAATGDANDVSYDNTTSGLTATDVQDAIDEIAAQSAGGVDSKTVYVTETAGGSSDPYSKRYGVYQGANGSSSSPVVSEKLVDIDIPKDMVVESGSVVDIVFKASDNTLHEGSESGADVTVAIKGQGVTPTAADAGKYIKLVIANNTSLALYIAAKDLVDVYTAQQNATQIQLAIDSNNVISATVVAGSIGTTELAGKAVTTAKIDDDAITGAQIADDAVGAEHIAIAAHTESQTASTDGLAISVTTTDGQVSAVSGSIAANTYDAYGAASTVQSDITGTNADTASDLTLYGLRAYADASTARIGETAIRALFA